MLCSSEFFVEGGLSKQGLKDCDARFMSLETN
jgi:hypothetical protein